jgi:glycosyltransferase involved in cell wall biosynthesis
MFTERTVSIITAATGHRNLAKCLRSVQAQTYAQVEHFVVIDGPEYEDAVRAVIAQCGTGDIPLHVIQLPYGTGRDNWCGHRIYAASSFLTNSEFVAFLDEDNWYEPDHISTLFNAVQRINADWAFSLRKIVNDNGEFVTLDNCECLGNLHPAWNNDLCFMVDTNCYFLRRTLAVRLAPIWYGQVRPPAGQQEPDRALSQTLLERFPKVASNKKHTVNYTVANRPNSVKVEYFLRGNEMMRKKYPNGLPWEKARP